MKTKPISEAQFLSLLQTALSKVTPDPQLSQTIYQAVAREVNLHKNVQSFEKFCETGSLPDVEPKTVSEFTSELQGKFGEGNVSITPSGTGKTVDVEIALPDRTITTAVKVEAPDPNAEEEGKTPFVPYPVALPQDPGLVWVLGRREDLGPDEAARALARIEEEFWQTKKGQQLQRDRVEKGFAEFILQVPAAALTEAGLKRHYKQPEPLQTLRLLGAEMAVATHGAAPF